MGRRLKLRARMRRVVPQIAVLVLVVVAWEAAVRVLGIPPYKLPPPSAVATRFFELVESGALFGHVQASLTLLLVAFVIGGLAGYVLGIAISLNTTVAAYAQPLVVFFQSIAGIAWIPIAITWFGFGRGPAIFVVANSVFFIVLFNTAAGVRQVPRVTRWAVSTLGATRWDLIREVVIPGASVSVLAGMVSGLAFAWRALVAVEIIVASEGLGYLTVEAGSRFDSKTVVVGILVIGVLWLLMERLVLRPFERMTVERWGLSRRSETRWR